MKHIVKELLAFKNNLDFQLEDMVLERSKASVKHYFDAADLFDIVLGLESFYRYKDAFDFQQFKDKRALVHSLSASGWIGPLELLGPHQLELLHMLRVLQIPTRERDPEQSAKQFLEDVGIVDAESFRDITAAALNKDNPYEGLRERAVLAETWFKWCQCIVPWPQRLTRLIADEILKISKLQIEPAQLMESEHFSQIKHGFDLRRPQHSTNNFSDALALCMLIKMVERYKAGESNVLPRFFLSSPLFQQVVSDTGVLPLLSYQSTNGSFSSVLRDADYYIFKACFLPRRNVTPSSSDLVDKATEEYLRGLRARITSIIEAHEPLPEDALEKIDFLGAPLSKVISDLQMFSFLENVWLKYDSTEEILQALAFITKTSREANRSKRFQDQVEQAIDELTAKIGDSVHEFRWIKSMWHGLEHGASSVRVRSDIRDFSVPALFRQLGLLRYGFPENANKHIRDALREFLSGAKAEQDACISVITACLRGKDNPKANLIGIVVGVAVLLVTKTMDSELHWLLTKIKPLPHFSLKIVLAEVLLKLNSQDGRAGRLLKQLEQEYQNAPTHSQKRGDLAVGIAYLYIRQWRIRGGFPFWRQNPELNRRERDGLRDSYLEKAITYARDAQRVVRNNPMKKVYSLNQHLFYLVEGGGDDRIPKMTEAAIRLAEYKDKPDLWQYRFDDTLARYFFRLAVIAITEERWTDMMTAARRHSDEASHKSHGDQEVLHFSTVITLALAAGYESFRHNRGV